MNQDEFKKLYSEEVLKRNREPYHFEVFETAKLSLQAYNPLCGDKYNLYIDEHEDFIESAHFHGFGCALSKASTSLLIEMMEGKNKADVVNLCQQFLEAVNEGKPDILDNPEQQVFAEMKNFDGRLDCVTLSWKALHDKLIKNED